MFDSIFNELLSDYEKCFSCDNRNARSFIFYIKGSISILVKYESITTDTAYNLLCKALEYSYNFG